MSRLSAFPSPYPFRFPFPNACAGSLAIAPPAWSAEERQQFCPRAGNGDGNGSGDDCTAGLIRGNAC
jgi:hypothetical protein